MRTALLRLEHDGLVVRERNRGARVRRVSPDEAVEILEARAALESLAAGYAATRRTDAELQELQAIVEEMAVLQADGVLDVGVYDLGGRKVASLYRGNATVGRRDLEWNGRMGDGGAAPSGVYFLKAAMNGEVTSRRIVLLRTQ